MKPAPEKKKIFPKNFSYISISEYSSHYKTKLKIFKKSFKKSKPQKSSYKSSKPTRQHPIKRYIYFIVSIINNHPFILGWWKAFGFSSV